MRIVDPLDPAFSVILRFGGVEAMSDITGLPEKTIRRWMRSRQRGGTGGIIPHWHHEFLLGRARDIGISISRADFMVSPANKIAS